MPAGLKAALDRLYRTFDFGRALRNDPIELPHQYRRHDDIEIVSFIACAFAYGRAELFKEKLRREIFGVMGDSPAAFIREFDERRGGRRFRDFAYRFQKGLDMILLIRTLRDILSRHGSLESLFMGSFRPDDASVRPALAAFIRALHDAGGRGAKARYGFRQLLPSPEAGGACKRLNMFLRWMVRDRDIDFGLWKGVPKDRLVIPLDTHIFRIAGCLGLTRRRAVDWSTAEEITAALRKFDPRDPVRYDFALCHQGISGVCRADRSRCPSCGFKAGSKA